jgi:hypothetical protein
VKRLHLSQVLLRPLRYLLWRLSLPAHDQRRPGRRRRYLTTRHSPTQTYLSPSLPNGRAITVVLPLPLVQVD